MNPATSATSVKNIKNVIDRPDRVGELDNLNVMNAMNFVSELPFSKAWPFKVGVPLTMGSIAATALYINSHYRKSLMLMNHMKFSSYLGVVVMPCVAGSLLFVQVITSDILQQKTKCGICLQTKAAALQGTVGIVYPLILAPLVSFPTAGSIKGLHLPSLTRKPKEVFSYSLEIMRPMWPKLRIFTLVHIVLAMGITHFQFDYFHSTVLPYLITGSVEKKKSLFL